MGDLFSATALSAGILFLLNPCSFALLPSYLGVFLNITQDEEADNSNVFHDIGRAQFVSIAMSAGLLAVFLPVGLAFQGFNSTLGEYNAWLSIGLGIALVALGVAMLLGFDLVLKLPKLVGGSNEKTFAGMFVYGASYAVAAMGCSLPILITGLAISSQDGFTGQLGSVVSFAAGMVVALTTLTVAVATGRSSLVNVFRKIMSKMNLITALILIPAGAYLAYFGYWELDPIGHAEGPIAWQNSFNNAISNWLDVRVGDNLSRAAVLGLSFIALNIALAVLAKVKRPSATSMG